MGVRAGYSIALLILLVAAISSSSGTYVPTADEVSSTQQPRLTFVNLCTSDIACCPKNASGSSTSTYAFSTTLDTISNHKTLCRLEAAPSTRLAVIDDQHENDCLVRYIRSRFPSATSVNYAIGLEDNEDEGVWKWQYSPSDPGTAYFQHWAHTMPSGNTDKNCAFMGVGTSYGLSGFWQDAACAGGTATYRAICEKTVP